jgi:hypothetical protein
LELCSLSFLFLEPFCSFLGKCSFLITDDLFVVNFLSDNLGVLARRLLTFLLLFCLKFLRFSLLGPIGEFLTDALLIFVFDVIAEALFGVSRLWIEAKSFLVASNFAGNVPFDSEGVAVHIIEASGSVAINLNKAEEDVSFVAFAHTILARATFDLLLLIWLTEALLGYSFGWVAELSIVALNRTFNLSRIETIVTHLDVAKRYFIEWASLSAIVNSSTALAIITLFLSTTLDWVWWLVNRVSLAVALLLVSIVGIAIKGCLSTHHIAVGQC